jgi:F-box protein 11
LRFHPIAFLSYVREDDQHEGGRLTTFRERLSGEVRIQTGEAFEIFQDRNDIKWGEQWKVRIENTLDAVTLLIPIITPAFFKRPACRDELQRFLQREKRLDRTDLILPVYYIDCPELNDEAKRKQDRLAMAIAERQYMDWRELRFESPTSPEVRKLVAGLARQIVESLERSKSATAIATVDAGTSEPDVVEPGGLPAVVLDLGSDVPTLIVDPSDPRYYPTLADAIKVAEPETRILVRPGLYRESIVMNKPIEIVGDGDKKEIVIEASGQSAILFKTSQGRIANLTLRQTGGGEWFGVDISQGKLELEDCDISSQSLACVAIHGGASPHLCRNLIHDGKSSGIVVFEGATGTLEHNEIFGNECAGVEIKEGGNPVLRVNRIHDGRSSGVLVHKGGAGRLEGNEIYTNAQAGVVIKEGGAPWLHCNVIHCGKDGGVFVSAGGAGTLEDNDIFGNTCAGVAISEGGNPTLRRNRVRDGRAVGVYVYKNGLGTLEDNEIFDNAQAGVETSEGGNPTVRHNLISRNRHGIRINEGGEGRFEGNNLNENHLGAWDIAAEWESRMKRRSYAD